MIIESEKALTGTSRRCSALRTLDPGIQDWKDFEECIPLGIQNVNTKYKHRNSKLPSRCVYNYEDRYEFKRIISDTDLVFDSHFESGNLKSAHRIQLSNASNFAEYNLHLHCDVHSVGHVQWFYFSVSNTNAKTRVKFNVGCFSKTKSLYNRGTKILCLSSKGGKLWKRTGEDICYYPTRTQELNKKGKSFTLTFTHMFEESNDTCYFASSYPYAYSDLQNYLSALQNHPVKNKTFRRTLLCRTLGRNRCDLITITAPTSSLSELSTRPGIVITARVHPGETNSSWICHEVLNFLTGDSLEAKRLRSLFVFKVIPMLNPDGVINGNYRYVSCIRLGPAFAIYLNYNGYRTSLAGVDLNRRWSNPSPMYQPTIHQAKKMIIRLKRCRQILMICDIHGHSRREGVFMYGCITKTSSFPDSSIFPRYFDNQCEYFSLQGCNYKMQECKASTMRVVMNRDLGISCSYTLEASLSGTNEHHFSLRNLLRIGLDFSMSLLQFYERYYSVHYHRSINYKNMNCDLDCECGLKSSFEHPINGKSRCDEDSAGSDSNPSDDNLSETEAIELLTCNLNYFGAHNGRRQPTMMRKKKIRNKTEKMKSKRRRRQRSTLVNLGRPESGQTMKATIKAGRRTGDTKGWDSIPMITFPI